MNDEEMKQILLKSSKQNIDIFMYELGSNLYKILPKNNTEASKLFRTTYQEWEDEKVKLEWALYEKFITALNPEHLKLIYEFLTYGGTKVLYKT